MQRRALLHALAAGGVALGAGCSTLGVGDQSPAFDDVVAAYRYEGPELVVEFADDAAVTRASIYDGDTDDEYAAVENPPRTARFRVVAPARLETYATNSLHLAAETDGGTVRERVGPATVHARARNVRPGPDGRALFDLENQTEAPLVVRFVAVHGDVPNPTVDPGADAFERADLGFGPGVLGTGENRPRTPDRTDLVVGPGETVPFETTYAPFASPEDAPAEGGERTGAITVVHAGGGSARYDFEYSLGAADGAR
jgi:hypothetical protein